MNSQPVDRGVLLGKFQCCCLVGSSPAGIFANLKLPSKSTNPLRYKEHCVLSRMRGFLLVLAD